MTFWIAKLKWKFNYKNIRQRYANFCGRLYRAKDGDCVAVDYDIMTESRRRNAYNK